MRRHHLTASSRILDSSETAASDRIAEALQTSPGEPVYEVLSSRYGLRPVSAREIYSAVSVDPAPAELLRVPSGSPALAVERVTYLGTGKPLEFVQSLIRGDRYSIILELEANRVPQAHSSRRHSMRVHPR